MSDRKIAWISGREPMRENEFPIMYAVGQNGVTRIFADDRNYGTYGVVFFMVWIGDDLCAEVNQLDVAVVGYE